jgi:mannose/fructose/N-acetylgalactosamine-specific phosphotransferase system component IID
MNINEQQWLPPQMHSSIMYPLLWILATAVVHVAIASYTPSIGHEHQSQSVDDFLEKLTMFPMIHCSTR